MATIPLQVPTDQQFGVGLFQAGQTFQALAGYRWSYPTAIAPVWGILDAAVSLQTAQGLSTSSGGVILPSGYIIKAGEQGLSNATDGMTRTQHAHTKPTIQYAQVFAGLGQAIEAAAAHNHQTRREIPRATAPRIIVKYVKPNIKALTAPLTKRLATTKAQAEAATKREKDLEARVRKLERQLKTVGGITIPGLGRREGQIGRRVGRLEREFQKISKKVLGAGLIGLLIEALSKVGGNWIRCSNNQKLGKSVCGMNRNLLESLIADALLVVSLVSVVEFAKELQGIESEVVKGIRFGVKELKPGFVPVAGKLH